MKGRVMKNSTKENLLFLLAVAACFILGLLSGCQTIDGAFQDIKFASTAVSNQTQRWADGESDAQRRMEEESIAYQQKKRLQILEYYEKKDQATADSYQRARANEGE